MKTKLTLLLTISAIILSVASTFYNIKHTHKIAFVRTEELVLGYNGMKQARTEFMNQSNIWQSNIDTLRIQYQRCLSEYESNYKSYTDTERREKMEIVKKLEENFSNYSYVIQSHSKKKEQEMTAGVLNQINSYIESFAKKRGYDIIIGSTNGNLLYGKVTYDITDELLTEINKEYTIIPSNNK